MEIEERIRLLEEENARPGEENKTLQEKVRYLLQEKERRRVYPGTPGRSTFIEISKKPSARTLSGFRSR